MKKKSSTLFAAGLRLGEVWTLGEVWCFNDCIDCAYSIFNSYKNKVILTDQEQVKISKTVIVADY